MCKIITPSWEGLVLFFLTSLLFTNQTFAAEFSADKLDYRGIFDESIYAQENAKDYEDATLRNLLKENKQAQIDEYFTRLISESEVFRKELLNRSVDMKGTAKEIIKGLLSGAAGWFSYRASVAVGETLERVAPKSGGGVSERSLELERQIERAQQALTKLKKGIDDEIIAILEDEYILKKRHIDKGLQTEIEIMLIRVRDENVELSDKMNFIRNALDLPTTHKVLDLEASIKAFYDNPYFRAFSDEVQNYFLEIICKICVNSNTPQDSKTMLRVTCFFHGAHGAGKTSSAIELAKTLGMPFSSNTIKHINELSPDQVNGRRWDERLGWLTEALVTKGPDKKCYTNGFLILNDYDRVLFPVPDSPPNETALNFLLELVDTDLQEVRNNYFKADINIARLNIFVTSNTKLPSDKELQPVKPSIAKANIDFDREIPEGAVRVNAQNLPFPGNRPSRLINPCGALLSRLDTLYFEGFSEKNLRGFLEIFIDELYVKYAIAKNGLVINELISNVIAEQRVVSGREYVELRDLKRRMENLIVRQKLHNIKLQVSNNI